jgi:hypothetical protein
MYICRPLFTIQLNSIEVGQLGHFPCLMNRAPPLPAYKKGSKRAPRVRLEPRPSNKKHGFHLKDGETTWVETVHIYLLCNILDFLGTWVETVLSMYITSKCSWASCNASVVNFYNWRVALRVLKAKLKLLYFENRCTLQQRWRCCNCKFKSRRIGSWYVCMYVCMYVFR